MSRPLFLAACALLAASIGACKSGKTTDEPDEGPTRTRVLLSQDQGDNEGPSLKSREWFAEEFARVRQLRAEGRIEEAIQRLFIIREMLPRRDQKRELSELLRELNTAVLDLETLGGVILAEEDPIEFGESLRVLVRLKNFGSRPIEIPAERAETSGSLFVLQVERREYDTRAQVVSTYQTIHVPLPADVAVGAGGTIEIPLDLGPLGNDRGLMGFRVYTIRGLLRPTVLRAGGLQRWDAIELLPGTLRSFRPNYRHLADDPVKRIRQAIEKDAGTHLLTAAALVPESQRTEAVDVLVGSVRGDRIIDWSIYSALNYLTKVELGRDAQAWRAWWPRVRGTFFPAPPEVFPEDQPRFGVAEG